MKMWTLAENTACREDLTAEHGLSLYIEACGMRILFDTGQSGAFADNAVKMGIDLQKVDFAVLSHGHYDHGGGLSRFLKENTHAPVYVSPHAFGTHYNAAGKYIGLDKKLLLSERIRFSGNAQTLAEGITLYSGADIPLVHPLDCAGMTMEESGSRKPEDFRHEQYLLLEENGSRILISGCSHRGILNIADHFRPDVLIGGFHFMKLPPEGEVPAAAKLLLQYDTIYHTGHCTGLPQYHRMKEIMGPRLEYLSTGTVTEI